MLSQLLVGAAGAFAGLVMLFGVPLLVSMSDREKPTGRELGGWVVACLLLSLSLAGVAM